VQLQDKAGRERARGGAGEQRRRERSGDEAETKEEDESEDGFVTERKEPVPRWEVFAENRGLYGRSFAGNEGRRSVVWVSAGWCGATRLALTSAGTSGGAGCSGARARAYLGGDARARGGGGGGTQQGGMG
jgi:hypothetical protein